MKSRYIDARTLGAVAGAGLFCMAAAPASAETRGYVISWFATATYNLDFKSNCPLDKNGGGLKLKIRELVEIGYTPEKAKELVENSEVNLGADVNRKIETRARVNGKPASVFNYPEATKDPEIETSSGRYAFGFDLGGKKAEM